MIANWIDRVVSTFSPSAGVKRAQMRRVLRKYSGAEKSRLNSQSAPRNQSADAELRGPAGADDARAWARMLVRDNSWAWGIVDTIVSSVVGCGITAQSMYETEAGIDVEGVNFQRDKVWEDWCKVCDINGQFTFVELQRMVQREIVEAGEVFIHLINTPKPSHEGIDRPVPLALEMIEADRIALDRDTFIQRRTENIVERGIEMDDRGKPIAYWVYPFHPNSPYVTRSNNEPVRIAAGDMLHLYRRDRVGQSRGVTWFAPIMKWIRDLGHYVDNELQASAVAACFGVMIKTTAPFDGLDPDTDAGEEVSDSAGNVNEYLEPGLISRLDPGDSIETVNPGRPNTGADAWIKLMLRGIAVGVGLSYETVARDYSSTNYSSSRTSQLEDRRRFRSWQQYLVLHMCQPIIERFYDAATLVKGLDEIFPDPMDLLEDRATVAPVEWQTPEWEWVDPVSEQAASEASVRALQSTDQVEMGMRGRNWRQVYHQRAKELRLQRQLGIATGDQADRDNAVEVAEVATAANDPEASAGSGEMSDQGRRQYLNNRKATMEILEDLRAGVISKAAANIHLQTLGYSPKNAAVLVEDVMPEEETEEALA